MLPPHGARVAPALRSHWSTLLSSEVTPYSQQPQVLDLKRPERRKVPPPPRPRPGGGSRKKNAATHHQATAEAPKRYVKRGTESLKEALLEDPPKEEWYPVFIEDVLMKRQETRMVELVEGGWTVEDPSKAVMYLICCGPVERILGLPERTPERPYLCYDCEVALGFGQLATNCLKRRECEGLKKLLKRRDIMYSSVDRRLWNMLDDDGLMMPGVTHAHPYPWAEELRRVRVEPSDPPSYFCTFQGLWNVGSEGSSFVRLNLAAMLNSSLQQPKALKDPKGNSLPLPEQNYTPAADIVINIARVDTLYKRYLPYYTLFDSSYSLVMHGHGRWSYRLMEVLSGGAIPVVMADGWRLPYEELIDWENISLKRAESLALKPGELFESLPRDSVKIQAMRKGVKSVYTKYFDTQELRAVSMLRSAALWKRNWKENEKNTLRMLTEKKSKR